MLGDADVDADPRLVDIRPIEPRVLHRLVAAVDSDAARPRAAPQVLFGLVAERFIRADPRQRLAT